MTESQRQYLLVFDGDIVVPDRHSDTIFWSASTCLAGTGVNGNEYPMGIWQDRPCWVNELSAGQFDSVIANGGERITLRSLLGRSEQLFALAGKAVHLINSHREHQYCGRCGGDTKPMEGEHARSCQVCGKRYYPRLSPCAIVLITKGDHCLLAQHRGRSQWHTCLAGYVEAGETVEQTVYREVFEEVKVCVEALSYFGSQYWPFPGQLMLGFHARYQSGDIEADGVEIVGADWFHCDQLPPHPGEHTLSGQLIRSFVERCKGPDNTL